MNALAIETMSLRPRPAGERDRAHAQQVANQFESVFVQTMVSSMRETSSIGGESMFGSGPGADTYAGWFDSNMADELAKGGGIGIAELLMRDMERHGEIDEQVERAGAGVQQARNFDYRQATTTRRGFDVVL